MDRLRRARVTRWSAVTVGIVALAAVPAVVGAVPVPDPGVPPEQVVADALASQAVAHQGLVQVDGRLGLPTLPVASAAAALLDESSRVRTWWASPASWRTDVVTSAGQEEEVATSDGVLDWSYESDRVTAREGSPALRLPQPRDLLPPAAARTVLAWIGPSDVLEPLAPRRIGGLAAAGARVATVDPRTSVEHVDVWVEPASGLPLELDVYTRGSAAPVFSTRFIEVSLDRPDPGVLNPVLSPGAHWSTDQRRDLLSFIEASGSADFPPDLAGLPALTDVSVPAGIAAYGVGFTRLAVLQLPSRLVPRVLAAVTATATAASDGSTVAVLQSPLVQVALVVRTDGAGFLLAGTLTAAAMKAALTNALPQLGALRAAP